jgi:hypothetical protein
MSFEGTWIETTSYSEDRRTLWVVRNGAQIVKVGEALDDISGANAFDQATAWALTHHFGVEGEDFDWKHQLVQGTFEHSRSTG